MIGRRVFWGRSPQTPPREGSAPRTPTVSRSAPSVRPGASLRSLTQPLGRFAPLVLMGVIRLARSLVEADPDPAGGCSARLVGRGASLRSLTRAGGDASLRSLGLVYTLRFARLPGYAAPPPGPPA
ncbi:hypothetical protein GCM10009630_58360 [Kribbella jejuensis]